VSDWLGVSRQGVRLECRDFGGRGAAVLMLHGLAGHSGEWAGVAALLGADFRVIALDQRGHGRSERHPGDLSRHAFVADVAAVVARLSLAPVALVGQSMGGNTAFLAASRHPELVRSLVVIEASPDGPSPELPARIRRWLDSWPTPFADEARAREFFSSQNLAPDAWTAGLERRDGALWPAFSNDVMVQCIAELAKCGYWAQWRRVRCPALLLRGQQGNFDADHYDELAHALPDGRWATIPNAGHDVHLDASAELADQVRAFLT
jgi:pimeloyl-ACP methyl ester carboxylesterase